MAEMSEGLRSCYLPTELSISVPKTISHIYLLFWRTTARAVLPTCGILIGWRSCSLLPELLGSGLSGKEMYWIVDKASLRPVRALLCFSIRNNSAHIFKQLRGIVNDSIFYRISHASLARYVAGRGEH